MLLLGAFLLGCASAPSGEALLPRVAPSASGPSAALDALGPLEGPRGAPARGGHRDRPSDTAPAPPWSERSRFGTRLRVPLRLPDRPGTLPEDHFEVRFSGAGAADGQRASGFLLAEADYGLSDVLQIGISLIRLRLVEAGRPDGGLEAPLLRGRARAVAGPLELGALASVGVPLEGFERIDAGGFAWLHVAGLARLELEAEVGARFENPTRVPLRVPARFVLGLGRRLALGGGARLEASHLGEGDLQLCPTAELILTLGDLDHPPLWSISAAVEGPPVALRGADPGDEMLARLGLSLFFDDPGDADPWRASAPLRP